MVASLSGLVSDPQNIIADFLQNYEKDNVFPYHVAINDMIAQSARSIVIYFEDIVAFDPNLAKYVEFNPYEACYELDRALYQRARQLSPLTIQNETDYYVEIDTKNDILYTPLPLLQSRHVDRLVNVKGLVTVEGSKQLFYPAVQFDCPYCGAQILVQQSMYRYDLRAEPSACTNPNCKSKKFTANIRESPKINFREYVVQEIPSESNFGKIPSTFSLVCFDNDPKIRVGDQITAMAILCSREIEKATKKTAIGQRYLHVKSIRSINDVQQIVITPEDEKKIKALAADPDIADKIARSIAPQIYGKLDLKKAAALALFGGVKTPLKRGLIHTLFLGDPSTGKSQILEHAGKLAVRYMFGSGLGLTPAGLLGGIEETSNGFVINAGLLLLASGGVAILDELDKFGKDAAKSLNTPMADDRISIQKIAHLDLPIETTIIAAANPINGRWRSDKPPLENTKLDPSLISRFDLTFVVRDLMDHDEDYRIAEKIVESYANVITTSEEKENDGLIEHDLLKKFIHFARTTCTPIIPLSRLEEYKKFVGQKYNELRGTNRQDPPIDPRRLDGIMRISFAFAKMRLHTEVSMEDILQAVEIVAKSIKQLSLDPITCTVQYDQILGKESAGHKLKSKIIAIAHDWLDTGSQVFTLQDLVEALATDPNADPPTLSRALDSLITDGKIWVVERDGDNSKYSLRQKKR